MKEHFDKIAEDYERLWFFSEDYHRWMKHYILGFLDLKINDKFVDIGGGTGKYTLELARATKICNEPICVEPSSMADIAARNDSLIVYNETANDFVKRDKRYNKVLIKEAIHHFPNRKRFFKELYKKMNDNGIFLIVTRPSKIKMPFFNKLKKLFYRGQPDFRDIVLDLKDSGFKTDVVIDTYKIKISKSRWYELLRGRFMSDLSKLTDEAIEDGIKELEKILKDEDIIVDDEIIFIIGKKG